MPRPTDGQIAELLRRVTGEYPGRGEIVSIFHMGEGQRDTELGRELRAAADALEGDSAEPFEILRTALHKIAYEPIGHPEAGHRIVLNDCIDIAREALRVAGGEGQ